MTADEIADAVVDHFNEIEDPIIVFQGSNPGEIAEADAERTDFAVFVIPNSESERPIDRGDMCDERRVVSVIVNGAIRGNLTKRLAMRFCEQLRRSLREMEFDDYRWVGNETTTLVDYAALKATGQFLSRFDAEFSSFQ